MQIELSTDQRKVLRKIWKWFVGKRHPFLTFGGYAGTGKTTMTALFRQALKQEFPEVKVAFCSYTGKAARVLEEILKNHHAQFPGDTTGTIHSLIYEPEKDEKGHILGWYPKDELKADLIIVDEASMVNRKIWHDLLRFEKPILAVGDHGQLPPVHGEFNLMENPNLRLEKIHRQARGNPIIELSEKVRSGKEIPYGDFGKVKKLRRESPETGELVEEILSDYNEELLVLVGYNRTRVQLNNAIREMQYRKSREPQSGDRIICLRNNHRKGIYNGMRGKIQQIEPWRGDRGRTLWYFLEAEMDNGELYTGKVLKKQFNQEKTIQELPNLSFKEMGDLFDFGYALTVHKAQGSQARQVLLFEERFRQMDDDDWFRWLYTAVTRAEEELVIVG
ncbi:MAG: AAA family ATPase [Patescibacteria group bacterium]|nr:AAA family ATPase [Patescibacteria group bacterium]